jgi:hypothetical protein
MSIVIGYKPNNTGGYDPIFKIGRGMIATHAFIICSKCGGAISANGGPAPGALHPECYENVKLTNFVEGGKNE